MGPIGLQELIVIAVIFGFPSVIADGIVFLVIRLMKKKKGE